MREGCQRDPIFAVCMMAAMQVGHNELFIEADTNRGGWRSVFR